MKRTPRYSKAILIAALLFGMIEVNIGGLRLQTATTAQACFTTLPPGSLWNVRRVNTPDTGGIDASLSLAADGNGTVIAVWQGISNNPVNPQGDDAATGGALNEDIMFARSSDYGRTWTTLAPIKTNAATDNCDDLEPSIATDGQGRWMVVWRSKDPLGGTIGFDTDILMTVSSDNGATWSAPAPVNNDAASDPGGVNDNPGAGDVTPTVCSGGAGRWMVSWMRYDNRTGSWQTSAMVASSSDNGAHWSNPVYLQTRSESGIGGLGSVRLAADRLGRWMVVWHSRVEMSSDYDIDYSLSTDNGASWSTAALLNSNGSSDSGSDSCPDVAADGQGQWVVTWHSDNTLGGMYNNGTNLFYARSIDNGQSWSAPATVNSDAGVSGASAYNAHLTYDGAGSWAAIWVTNGQGGDADLVYSTHNRNGSNWAPLQQVTPWAGLDTALDGGWYNGLSIATDGKGSLLWAWNTNYEMETGTNQDWDVVFRAMIPLGQAANNTALTWVTTGDASWFGSIENSHDGLHSLQSGYIGDNQSSVLTTTVTGPGELSFWWAVSSETNCDWLSFYIDGVEQSGKISGSVDWQQKSYSLSSGPHQIKWEYTKDGSVYAGQDCAWVDGVSFDPVLIEPTGLSAVPDSRAQITLHWTDNSNFEEGYKIERSTTNGIGFVEIATVSTNVTSFQDAWGLLPNTDYYYRVQAFRGTSESVYSNVAGAKTLLGSELLNCP